VPYTAAIFPTGDGSVAVSPAPQSYPGVSGVYFVARQQATLTAVPIGPFQFYEFNNANFWLPGGLGANPKTFFVPDTGLAVNTTAEFAPAATVYTIGVTPDPFSSNLYIYADGGFSYAPKNFAPFYDSNWTSGSTHTINVDTLEYPFSSNTRYAFSSWSDSGAQSHSIVLPGGGATYTATLIPQFLAGDNFNYPPCGGNATLTPASPTGDGFYPSGQVLTYTATPDATWTFAGWTYDLTGTTNPNTLTATDETLVFANFNTTNTPLTLTSISPTSAASGGPSFTLTLNGTGFTTGSFVSVNGAFITPAFVSSTQLKVTVPATDITAPTAFQVYVENFPTGWTGCANFGYQPFFVYQAPPAPIITPSPASLTFGSQVVGTTSPSQPVTVTNSGALSTTISIAPSGDFAETNTCPATLNAGTNCTVNVTFTPTATGSRTGSITITDTAANSPQTVSLTGTGAANPVTVTATPATLTFASQAIGTTSPSKPITVKNTGTASTSISVAITGDYAQTNNCPATLAAKANCKVNVTFTPTVAGTRTGTVTLTDTASNSPQTVSLTGTGAAGSGVTVTATPATLTFTSQAVGTSSASKPVTVKNTGGASTTISITSSGDFTQTNNCGTSLAAGASCIVNSTFSPTTTGSISGAITIADTASNSPQIVSLTGTAVVAVTLSPATLPFGSVAVGATSAAKTATITNNLSTALTFSFAASGNYAAVGSGTSPCGASLAAASSCTLSVAFTPTANGSIDGAITVAYAAAYSPQEVKLTGSGTGGGTSPLKFTPTTLAFSSQAVGTTSATKSVTVQNTSAASVTISSIASTGDFTESGSGATPCGAIALAPSASCTLSVTFSPSISGSLQGAVVISDNAAIAQQVINITGTAVVPVTIAPTSLTFAAQTVGTTSAAQSLTLTNNAGSALTLTSFTGSGDFSVTAGGTTPCGASVAANSSCTLSVTFTPTATGTIKGAATITDAASTSPQTVKLTGTGQ
jgi:Abnormal spindle-like microcephaly-assoc'd, ASPM-SPD-2-Hydin/Divergent InlB B-repeat domain